MTDDIYEKVGNEIRTLFGLTLVNMVMAALVMGFGTSFAVTQILATVEGDGTLFAMLIFAVVGIVAAAIGIRWLLSVVSVMEGVLDVREKYQENKKDSEGITGVIVQMLATYRSKKSTLERMVKISKIGGVLFAFSGFLQLMAFLVTYTTGDTMTLLTGIVGVTVVFCIALVCFLIPKYYGQFSKRWDARIAKSCRAETELKEKMETDL